MQRAKHRFGLPEEARGVSGYDAGHDGLWLHRVLATHGVENGVARAVHVCGRSAWWPWRGSD
jgi:hypothetical protein